MGGFRRMGRRVLSAIFRKHYKSLRDCAQDTGIDVNKLYNSKDQDNYMELSEYEKDLVYQWMQERNMTTLSKEEVFNDDVDNLYEFDTVYKSEAIARTRRNPSHKR